MKMKTSAEVLQEYWSMLPKGTPAYPIYLAMEAYHNQFSLLEKTETIITDKTNFPGSEPEGKGFNWTDDLVKRYAEIYRFSSSRTSIEQFKENPDYVSQKAANKNYDLAMQEVKPEGKEAVEFKEWCDKNGQFHGKRLRVQTTEQLYKIWKQQKGQQ